MKSVKAFPLGVSVIYFNDESKNIYADLPPNKEQAKRLSKRIYDESKNIYADLPPNKEQAKRLSKRIYKDAMTAVCTEQASGKALAPACD